MAAPGVADSDRLAINTLRFLAVDAVEAAKSGHPGLPLGCASMAYVLWTRFLHVDPSQPDWPDRDRFVLSAGHGSALLYGLLHLSGFDLPLDELKRFRQWGSRTPGHPEAGLTPGVEATTGPLGQGLGNAVGMAIAESWLAARYNTPGNRIVDHRTYCLASDGDLMEGVSHEAASLAGHLRLGRLLVLYDDNRVTIEGSTSLAFSEDVGKRFEACGWMVQHVEDGNDLDALRRAIEIAKAQTGRPNLVRVRTHIGFGSPNKADTAEAHGEPLGAAEARLTKERLGWPVEPAFRVPPEARERWGEVARRGRGLREEWEARFAAWAAREPALAAEFQRVQAGELPEGWDRDLPVFRGEGQATRAASGKVLNVLASRLPELVGGSADLAPSTRTLLDGQGDFEVGGQGRNLHFGVREHGMGAVLNGMALHRGVRPFGATFLIFSDYMRPPMRLAAMTHLPVVYVFTHDSLGLGEDGPTHQPVEQLAGLRSVPGLHVYRPADANETSAAWALAIARRDGPTALALTRQKVPVLDPDRFPGVRTGVARGGYVLSGDGDARVVLVATGSEVHVALEAAGRLAAEGLPCRVVSVPCVQRFLEQPAAYRDEVLPPGVPRLVVEAGSPAGWTPFLGPEVPAVAVRTYGSSAPGAEVLAHYGFTAENVAARARELL